MDIFRCINAKKGDLVNGGAPHRDGARQRALTRCCALPLTTCICVLVCLLAFAAFALAGTLTTLDGQSYDGPISFEANNTLLVSPRNGAQKPVALSNVLHATLVPESRPLWRGVVLTTGEAIAANSITRLDSDDVRLVRPGGIAVELAATDVASVIFRPITPVMQRHIPIGHAGAVLDNGDFFEGDPAGFEANQVKISSVLFGIQSFDVGKQARAVVLQDAASPDANEVVRLVDGSVLLGKSASISQGRLTIDDARLGSITVEARTVAQISMGGDTLDTLTRLAPSKVDGTPIGYAIDATTAGVAIALLGTAPAHGIGQRPGVSLTWDVGGKYKSVIAKAGVPLEILPLQRLQFVVLADAKEVFRSPPISSVDDPVTIAVSLADVQTLTFRVEGPDAMAPGATGLWADPILVRGKNN
jgi:hypothetical protein